MPIIKSAKKRVRTARKARARNQKTKRNFREAIKNFTKVLAGGKPAEIAKAQSEAVSALDIAAKKKVIHKNKAARQKAALAAQAKRAGYKPTKSTAKVAPKATAAKKPAKKPATKKPAKKSTAKKPATKK